MSFGTGHHETTHMMIQHLLETEVTGMKTLDMGCVLLFSHSSRNERRSANRRLITGVELIEMQS
jgi:hypothetical protein